MLQDYPERVIGSWSKPFGNKYGGLLMNLFSVFVDLPVTSTYL